MLLPISFIVLYVVYAGIFVLCIKKALAYPRPEEKFRGQIPVLTRGVAYVYKYNLMMLLSCAIVSIPFGVLLLIVTHEGIAGLLIIIPILTVAGILPHYLKIIYKMIFYITITEEELVCLNGKKKATKCFSKEDVKAIRVCRLSYKVPIKYSNDAQDRFIVLLFKGDDLSRQIGMYDAKETLTNHYMLIAYTPETLEILKQHLNVPVIFEDGEQL